MDLASIIFIIIVTVLSILTSLNVYLIKIVSLDEKFSLRELLYFMLLSVIPISTILIFTIHHHYYITR